MTEEKAIAPKCYEKLAIDEKQLMKSRYNRYNRLKTIYDSNNELKPARFSMAGYREQDWMVNVPLYLATEWMSAAE